MRRRPAGFPDRHGKGAGRGPSRLAKKYGTKVLAFAGGVTKDAGECNAAGNDAFFHIVRGVTILDEAMVPENARGKELPGISSPVPSWLGD